MYIGGKKPIEPVIKFMEALNNKTKVDLAL
jgi:hypothetical protein